MRVVKNKLNSDMMEISNYVREIHSSFDIHRKVDVKKDLKQKRKIKTRSSSTHNYIDKSAAPASLKTSN